VNADLTSQLGHGFADTAQPWARSSELADRRTTAANTNAV